MKLIEDGSSDWDSSIAWDQEWPFYVLGSINSHHFHIKGDKLINPIVGVNIPMK